MTTTENSEIKIKDPVAKAKALPSKSNTEEKSWFVVRAISGKEKKIKHDEGVRDTEDKAIGKDEKGRTIYEGPRGGHYYINANGNKTYIKRDKE